MVMFYAILIEVVGSFWCKCRQSIHSWPMAIDCSEESMIQAHGQHSAVLTGRQAAELGKILANLCLSLHPCLPDAQLAGGRKQAAGANVPNGLCALQIEKLDDTRRAEAYKLSGPNALS